MIRQFMHAPIIVHLEAAYCVFRYLKKSLGRGMQYSMSSFKIEAYTDLYLIADLHHAIVCLLAAT